ncbi:MAG: hypothetical protein M3Y28_08715 [Armatimonadota bacterium]|nr:hypothetical protein [Armatimonadota bacterium]
MRWKQNAPPLVLGLIAVLAVGWFVQWRMSFVLMPHPDWAHLGAYENALRHSRNPKAIAIRNQINAGPADLARERAEAQREGIPVTIAQLTQPLPPAGENAATIYDRWNALRRSKPLRLPVYAAPMSGRYAYTPAQIAWVQNAFAARPDLFTLLHQATDKPQCVFTTGFKDPFTGLIESNNASLREAARELETESFLMAHAGRYSEAVTTQARGFRVARHAAATPTLIGYLVGNAIDAITLAGLSNILAMAGPNPAVDEQIRQTIAAPDSRVSMKKALAGEVAVTLKTIDYCRAIQKPSDLVSLLGMGSGSAAPPPSAGNYSPDERRFLNKMLDAAGAEDIRRMHPLIAAADQPPFARRAAFAPYKDVSLENSYSNDQTKQVDPVRALLGALAPVWSDVNQSDTRLNAQEQVLMAAATVLSARARTGAFPARLPGVYTDPFNDKPLGYRREGKDGFVVYSVGPEGTFTGGKSGVELTTRNFRESLFRYPRPALKPVPPDMLK